MSTELSMSLVVEVIAVISGIIVSIGVPIILNKLSKINELHTTIFGVESISSVGGLVDIVKDNKDNIHDIEESIVEIEDHIDDIEKTQREREYDIESIKSRIDEMRKK